MSIIKVLNDGVEFSIENQAVELTVTLPTRHFPNWSLLTYSKLIHFLLQNIYVLRKYVVTNESFGGGAMLMFNTFWWRCQADHTLNGGGTDSNGKHTNKGQTNMF